MQSIWGRPSWVLTVRQNGVQHPQKLGRSRRLRLAVYLCRRALSLRKPCAILSKWFLPTRLETRTKESNIYASMLVQKPSCVINVIDAKLPAASTDHVPLDKGLSMSISVRTRKMVNYAWVGWSQGKLWWRLVAVLTCKSIVKLGYRGERLIEPSSSWFPPKFPSG